MVERLRGREKEPVLQMHLADAAARQIADGDEDLAPGIWWASHSLDGKNINQIVRQDEADMGGGGCFYDARVFVEAGV